MLSSAALLSLAPGLLLGSALAGILSPERGGRGPRTACGPGTRVPLSNFSSSPSFQPSLDKPTPASPRRTMSRAADLLRRVHGLSLPSRALPPLTTVGTTAPNVATTSCRAPSRAAAKRCTSVSPSCGWVMRSWGWTTRLAGKTGNHTRGSTAAYLPSPSSAIGNSASVRMDCTR